MAIREKLVSMEEQGRVRVIIEGVKPEIDGGRFPIKRVTGDEVVVEADIFADGHDALSAPLLYRKEDDPEWAEIPMALLVNDRWQGSFVVTELGHYRYTLTAWVDRFKSWQQDLVKRVKAGQDISVNLLVGAQLITEASQWVSHPDSQRMHDWAKTLQSTHMDQKDRAQLALSDEVARLMDRYSDRQFAATYPKELLVVVDREKARLLPQDPEQLRTLLDAYLLEKAVNEIGYELNNRPDWVQVPLQGILQLIEASE